MLQTLLNAQDHDSNISIQVLHSLLKLDGILLISDQQARQFVQGAVSTRWAWALHALSVRPLPFKAAWKALGPRDLTAAFVYFVGDDDFPEANFPFVDELVSHAKLRQLSGQQLTSVLDAALAAKERGPFTSSINLRLLASGLNVATEVARMNRVKSKITNWLLSLLLMLPAVDEVSADVLQRWIAARMNEQQADCVPRLLSTPAASELPESFVLDLVRFCVSGAPRSPVDLLAKLLVHPVIAQGSTETSAVVEACIGSCSPSVRCQLIGLFGKVARLLCESQEWLRVVQPSVPITQWGPTPQPQLVLLLGKLNQLLPDALTDPAPSQPAASRHPGEQDAREQPMAGSEGAAAAVPLVIDLTNEDDDDDELSEGLSDDEEEWI
jgi:hypothetical protein